MDAPPLRRLLGAAASLGALAASPAFAQEAPAPTRLDPVTVIATKTPQSLSDAPANVSTIEEAEIDRRNLDQLRDVTRYEPGVEVGNQPGRTGATNYVIRGIGGNRVRVEVDGTRLPDFPGSNQGAGTYTRDFLDLDQVKRIEILRGPASALYGSDAIGGVVSYVTKDPADYLAEVGKDWFLGGKLGHDGADRSFRETATGAVRAGGVEALAQVTRRDGKETGVEGFDPNPADTGSTSLLAKFVLPLGGEDRVRLTGEAFRRRVDTELLNERAANVLDSDGSDETRRIRLTLDGTHGVDLGWLDRVSWRLNWTDLAREELTDQRRLTAGTERLRFSDLDFEQRILGGSLQLESTAKAFGADHLLTYGLDLEHAETSRPRDRFEVTAATGAVTRTFPGGPGVPAETFPNKNFPDTETIQAGAYLQDQATWGRLTVTPAVRLDWYRLDPSPDAAFANTNLQGFAVREVTDAAVSPKLGLAYRLTDAVTAFGQYARGFRAPPYDDANIGFTNGPARYEILPNPDLEPETSDSFELGLRAAFAGGSAAQASVFYNRYRDFIESVAVGTRDGLTQFQARNLSRVTIYGAEAKGEWRLSPEWGVFGSLAYAEGEDRTTGLPIDSVAPVKAVLGLRYDAEAGWGGELIGTHAWAHDEVSDPTFYQAPAYTVLDAVAYWDATDWITLNAGVFNLLDQRYFRSQDVVGVAAGRTDLGRFAQPGRTVALNAVFRW
jgi:hemoglobin/transferrin/lactoferrin receptor protein